MRSALRLALAAAFLIFPSILSAQPIVRVPQNAKDLQAAINTVADGGIIEMAAGTYSTPARGFEIANERKGFTVRAAGTVVLDGGGVNQILRYENGRRDRGKLVTFQGITFRNGASLTEGYAGGVTLSAAEARFVGCVFENNTASGRSSGGGAVRVLADSEATFVSSVFRNNTTLNRGGAIEVILATATIQASELVDNRVNLPGGKNNGAGGGIYVLDGKLVVSGTRFQGNQASWVGGAIYGFGRWADPVTTPRALIEVSRSTFVGNTAGGGTAPPSPNTGAAIHVEDQATLEVDSSLFSGNVAEFGGAIDVHRAIAEIRGSWFQSNRGPLTSGISAGGAIFVSSVDFADDTTGGGAINRRPSTLVLSDSLFQGGGTAAHTGGCVVVGGDDSRVHGTNGVPAAGSIEENRARFEIRRTVFSDCDVQTAPGGGAGMGGAIQASLVDLLMEDSLVMTSDAPLGGGGMAIGPGSAGVISRTTFANNSAKWGGALHLQGAAVQIVESSFLGNQAGDRGSAIYSIPGSNPARNAGGLVTGSVFTANGGIPVWDNDSQPGAINEVRYNSNQFHVPSGDQVYGHDKAGTLTAAQLNNLVVGSTDKSDGGNARLTAAPRLGTVLAVPPFLGAGAPGSPGRSVLAFAWSGRSANLAGQTLSAKAGLIEIGAAGDHALNVDGGPVDSARIVASACTSGPSLCMNGDRFVAEVSWRDFSGQEGTGKAVSLSGDTGYFWFFDENNVELVVKVLDGRGINGSFWVFYGALSSVQYTLRITDTVTGRVRTYQNPSGKLASASDTSAFPAAGAASSPDTAAALDALEIAAEPLEVATAATCSPGPTDLCLDGRFRVSLRWNAQGQQGAGQSVPLTSDTGYFWFFQQSNVEVIVKVLDGRPLNGHFWVFYGALTDVEYELTVTDTVTGRQSTYRNPRGRMASVGDTSALPQ